MIKLNDHVIEQDCFGDGTLKCALPAINSAGSLIVITWCYDNDAELFTLWSLVCYIRDRYPDITLNLAMPYIPHARQDREVSHRLFTLKYFAKLINAMNKKSGETAPNKTLNDLVFGSYNNKVEHKREYSFVMQW